MTGHDGRAGTFDRLFDGDPDPWNFAHSEYERAKREASIAALPRACYGTALEVGCATGYLTAMLAPLCDRLVALDTSHTALQLASDRLKPFAGVQLVRADVPADWPAGAFDLVVLSEVLYFLGAEEIADVARLACGALAQDGHCLLVNWTGQSNLPLTGDEVVDLFERSASWQVLHRQRAENYRLDLFASNARP
ncbi:SAM-dependent methyltransferase [Croceicoccus sp. F390]|uniref:SAM-dependent methyltransferase n=1 Tax=Croceicoccus esteveae TaxID=3075597 RepID=A0ABU2ZH45_9SPHN|nr:SAM-dependent methyltransferase [Croceicoccus sp. F390]MDT0575919.1 SAM-dependent methyltransferase [Croceicoccus sp. F390]